MLSTTILARPDIPVMREEITKQIYVPSAAEQQKLTDTEYNAYRRSGLITKARSKETEVAQEGAKEEAKEVASETASEKKEGVAPTQENTGTKAPVKRRRARAVAKKEE